MASSDPHSYADLSQGRIEHIVFQFVVDFVEQRMRVLADYRLAEPISGSFFLDTRNLDISRVHVDDKDLSWEIDQHDSILGDRLHLHDLKAVQHSA